MTIQTKKTLTLVAVVVLLLFISITLLSFFSSSNVIGPQPTPSPFVPKIITERGDTVTYQDDDFSIVYQPIHNLYLITIARVPFVTVRQKAEAKFLEITKLDKIGACSQKISIITTPRYEDPTFEAVNLKLSFCKTEASPGLTQPLPLNPQTEGLNVVELIPSSGEVEMANTFNSISLVFSAPVDPSSVYIESSPAVAMQFSTHPKRQSELFLNPQGKWQVGQNYRIVIKAGVLSQDKKFQLKEDYVINYSIKPVNIPEGDHRDEGI